MAATAEDEDLIDGHALAVVVWALLVSTAASPLVFSFALARRKRLATSADGGIVPGVVATTALGGKDKQEGSTKEPGGAAIDQICVDADPPVVSGAVTSEHRGLEMRTAVRAKP